METKLFTWGDWDELEIGTIQFTGIVLVVKIGTSSQVPSLKRQLLICKLGV